LPVVDSNKKIYKGVVGILLLLASFSLYHYVSDDTAGASKHSSDKRSAELSVLTPVIEQNSLTPGIALTSPQVPASYSVETSSPVQTPSKTSVNQTSFSVNENTKIESNTDAAYSTQSRAISEQSETYNDLEEIHERWGVPAAGESVMDAHHVDTLSATTVALAGASTDTSNKEVNRNANRDNNTETFAALSAIGGSASQAMPSETINSVSSTSRSSSSQVSSKPSAQKEKPLADNQKPSAQKEKPLAQNEKSLTKNEKPLANKDPKSQTVVGENTVLAASTVLASASGASTTSTNSKSKKKPKKKKSRAVSGVPPGFEFLLEPQTTQADVYYGERYLSSTLITYSPGEVEFNDPESIVNLIPGVIDRDRLTEHLTGKLDSHAYEICGSPQQTDCGRLTPEVADVIFDESRYRVDLFVAQSELSVQQVTIPKYLPASDVGFSFLHGLSAAYSDQESLEKDYSVNGNTLVGFGESRLRMFSNYSREDDFVVDVLAFERDFSGLSYQLGLLQTDNQNAEFLPTLQVTGARFASTLDTRNDLDFSEGTPLTIFLPTRSRVELFKDGRLASSKIYEAGNQSLDTTTLPGGAYDVTIRVLEGSTVVREEVRFYRKTAQIPPADQDIYFVEVGQIMDDSQDSTLPDGLNNHLLRGGYATRILEGLGLDGSAAVAESDAMLEAGMFYLGKHFDATFSLAQTEHSDKGYFAGANTRFGNLMINGRYRKIDLGGESISDDPDDVFLLGDDETQQGDVRVSYPIGQGRLNLESRVNKRNQDSITTNTVSLNFSGITLASKSYASVDFEVSEEEDNWQALIRLSLNFATKHMQYKLSQLERGLEDADNNRDRFSTTEGSVTWNDRDMFESEVDVSLNAVKEDERKRADLEASWESRLGLLSFSADHTVPDEGDSTSGYGAFLTTTILGDAEGIEIGGSEINQSAVIIDIDSPSKLDGYFDVLVDGNRRTYAEPGHTTVMNVRPFETYKVQLKDKGTSLLSYDQKVEEVTLYPGNVKRMKWKVGKVDVVFGRLVTPEGEPVANALVEGVVGLALTDEFGLFQAEINQGTKALTAKTRKSSCAVEVPDYKVKRQVGRLGTLTCQ